MTYITGFDVFTDVLLEGKLGTSFVPVALAKEECSVRKASACECFCTYVGQLVALLPDNKMKLLAANGERTVLRPASLTPEVQSSFPLLGCLV